jgi:hypothetical protein
MQVLIISPYRTVAPHFETELEIAQRHRDAGDTVTFASCLGELDACDFNPSGERDVCTDCRLRREDGIRKVSPGCSSIRLVPLSTGKHPSGIIPRDALRDIESLKAWKVKNFDIGFACLSSLVSLTRNPAPDLRLYRQQLQRFASAAMQTYENTFKLLTRRRPDCVYLFNGRFASMRAVLRACESARVTCYVHERGCDKVHFQLFRNHLPHDITQMTGRMRSFWTSAAWRKQREQDAALWFHGRVARVEMNWRSFVKDQQRGVLPEDWNSDRHNIVLFTSSEDEFVAIGDSWNDRLYPDQAIAIARIARDLKRVRPKAHLTVRIHPNLIGIDNESTRRLAGLNSSNITVIPADQPTDSYQLMRMADTVATFGSTIGIESVFWARPSVLLGPCFYQNMRGVYRAMTHKHAVQLLAHRLMPKAVHDALIYGYWEQRHGIRFKYFEPDDLFTGRFKGEIVYGKPRKTILRYVNRRIASVRKRLPEPLRRAG